ncbi:MAG TPA: hypothetical protein VGN32_21645 [Ktedonobacterales bacterium]|jgi:hypothetical protein|nr:hypothetical protein [Ktedonobacterales bacterium]
MLRSWLPISNGIPNPQVTLVQPLRIADAGKILALSTLDAPGPAILAQGLATEDEFIAAREDLAALTADPHSLIAGPRDFQAWSRR